MFTGLEVNSPQVSIPTLGPSFLGIDLDYIQIRNIEGLEPVKATINTEPFATLDGESYSGSFVGKRNIVLTLGLNPNYEFYSMEGLRRLLYRYFMPKSWVTLRVLDSSMPNTEIQGIVEDVAPSIFSKDPEMQVSVICPNADFVASSETVITGEVSNGLVPVEIAYTGNVSTGFVLKIESSEDMVEYTGLIRIISESLVPEILSIPVVVDEDNYFEMSSLIGSKYTRSIRVDNGAITNRFNALDTTSKWPKLYPGTNLFSVISELGSEGQTWELKYYGRYGGL